MYSLSVTVMGAFLAAQVAPTRDQATAHAVPAADTAALSLVALLFFCVACFVWGAAVLGRRERQVIGPAQAGSDDQPQPAGEASPPPSGPVRPRAPWERESDWWKKAE
jgi:hypothetical protein